MRIVQFAGHDTDASNDPDRHVKMVHQLTSEARNVSLAGFSACSLKAHLRAFNPVNVHSVHD
jgi:hypothetical protein